MQTFFVLKPATWSGAATHLCRPLIGAHGPKSPLPWVAIARGDYGKPAQLVRLDKLAPGQARAVIAEAEAWFGTHKRTWQVLETRGIFRKTPSMIQIVVATAAGLMPGLADDLAGEQLLNPAAMLEAQAHFGLKTDLVVMIAKRGQLVITAFDPPQFAKTLQYAREIFGRAGDNGICPVPIVVRANAPVGYLDDNSVAFPGPGAEWNVPPDSGAKPPINPVDAVLGVILGRPEARWNARDLSAMVGFDPIPVLKALTERGFLVQLDTWHWQLAPKSTKAAAPVRPTRRVQTGKTLHRLGIELPASSHWADTGLQPDVLGTRPLMPGMTLKLRWNAVCDPRAKVLPIIFMRHVPDPARASTDATFSYSMPDKPDAAIAPSLADVRLAVGTMVRFPKTPGRIEARIAGASGPSELIAVAGTIRLEFHTAIAGANDRPLRADHVALVNSDDFPAFPELPAVEEPYAWHAF